MIDANIILYMKYTSRLISSLHSQFISFSLLINIIDIMIFRNPRKFTSPANNL